MPSSSLPYGNPGSINSITLVYDALGRMVEQQNGSTYTQMLYSPVGKTAIMNGQTLSKAFVGLPGGGTAIYKSSGLAYYRHADWLGSSRLTSTVSQTVYSDSAYAPFGEQYAVSGTADPSFTGQDSDTVSSLYDFTFREQSPSQGRWISFDPAGMKSARPLNPQSWNRYAYVNNNPLALVDPKGLDCVYLNDSGTDVEEVDAGDDCASGGIWVPSTYAGSGWVDSNDGTVVGLNSVVGSFGFITGLSGDDSISSVFTTSASSVTGLSAINATWPGAGNSYDDVSQEQGIVSLMTGFSFGGYLGLPDYYSLNLAVGGWAGNVQVSNTGNWYFTEAGVGTPGVSVTAGWIDTPGVTSDQFLPGYGGSVGYFNGFTPGLVETWSPGYGTATEMGAGTPGAGASFGYTFCYQGASSCWP
jgi:RHS repeat-associated protein